MRININNVELLELVELYAEDRNSYHNGNFFVDASKLSDLFDEEVLPGIVAAYGRDDVPAISEAFSAFTDALAAEGRLHTAQVAAYSYIGELS